MNNLYSKLHNDIQSLEKDTNISNLDHNFNSGVEKSRAKMLVCSEIVQSIRQSSNVEAGFQEITLKLLDLLQVDHVSIYKLDKPVKKSTNNRKKSANNHKKSEVIGQIVAEAIAPNWDACSQVHIENILREEYQWGQETSGKIIDFYTAGLTRCDLNFAEVFRGKAYLLIPIVLSAQEVPLWGFLTVHQRTTLNEKTFQDSWDQDDVLMLQQIAMQIEIVLERSACNISLIEQVRESEQAYATLYRWMEQYRHLVEQIPSISYVSPIANTPEFAYISPQLQTLLGIPLSEWNAGFFNGWIEYVHPDDRDRVQKEVRHTIKTGSPLCCEYRMVTSDGKTIWMRDNARMGLAPDGKTQVLRGSAFDISDRKQIEQALTKSEAMLEKSQQIAKMGNWEWNVVDNEIIWSKELFHIFERDPPLGTPTYEEHLLYFVPEDREKLDQLLQKAVHNGESYRIELQILKSGKPYHYVESIGHAEYDDNQQVSKLYGTVQDISDRRIAEAKIAAASLAEAANLAKTEFLAMMSHELRTPMNAVIGMTDILLNTPLSLEQQGYVAMIQRGGEMLLSVISNILDFSQIESGKLELEDRPLNLRQCIKEVLELMTFHKAKKSLKLDALIGIDVPQQIMGDYARLRQILINLVSNAIKFTENGAIVITVSSQLLDQSTNTYELQFDVRDTGIGISDEQITKLFKAFSQADKSITRQYGGTGLGLAICKQLCELMGGTISVTSTVGVGSTFSFSIVGQAIANNLDVISTEAVASNLKDKKVLSRLNQNFANQYPFKILIVEDNPVNQQILFLMLDKLGYSPQASSNGMEALTNLMDQSYDVIIMDIEMPIMDGLTASRKIRQLSNRTPWIIGLSANAFTESREIALAAGMNDYLTKPLQVDSMIAALKRVDLSLNQENNCQVNMCQVNKFQALDLQTLEVLGNAVCKENLPNLINLYLEHSNDAIADMHKALSNKDIHTIDAKNHSFKGGSETFGAIPLAKSCQELQLVCRHLLSSQSFTDEDTEEIADILDKMESEFKLASQAFQKYLDL